MSRFRAIGNQSAGIFAVGDVRSGSVKRCAAAVGEGGMAVAGCMRRWRLVTAFAKVDLLKVRNPKIRNPNKI